MLHIGHMTRAAGVLLVMLTAACQPETENPDIPPGAIPAADDARPGSEAAPSGVMMPGAVSDTADPSLPAVDTLADPQEVTDTL